MQALKTMPEAFDPPVNEEALEFDEERMPSICIDEGFSLPPELILARRLAQFQRERGHFVYNGDFWRIKDKTRFTAIYVGTLDDFLDACQSDALFQRDMWHPRVGGALLKKKRDWLVGENGLFMRGTIARGIFELTDGWIDMPNKMCHKTGIPEEFAVGSLPFSCADWNVEYLAEHTTQWRGIIANQYPSRLVSSPTYINQLGRALSRQLLPQQFKWKVPFLIGDSNVGKTSLMQPFRWLYGKRYLDLDEAKGFSLGSIKECMMLFMDEFSQTSMKHGQLMKLLQHDQVSINGKWQRPITVEATMGKVLASNQRPDFRGSYMENAWNNRVEEFDWSRPIEKPNPDAKRIIYEEEAPYVIGMLAHVYCNT